MVGSKASHAPARQNLVSPDFLDVEGEEIFDEDSQSTLNGLICLQSMKEEQMGLVIIGVIILEKAQN